MGKINELSISIANLIAAGEVVNRPASAIKELVENAIDAGATRIGVEIQKGGIALMRVTDNGCGMEADDLAISIKRHATSKIKDKNDLERIMTMGFRGEALPSIASVSKLRIVSKTEEAEFGNMLTVKEDGSVEITERGAATGTTVIAEDLFYNVPARRKFLKRDAVEAGAVISAVEKLALSHPEIAFSMISDGIQKLETPGTGKLSDTMFTVFGKDIRGKILAVDNYEDGIRVYGYIGSPIFTKVNRSGQFFFVNKRCVSSPMMSSALSQAFSSYIPEDKFPFAVLFTEVNPLAVDVNIHPAKLEVKFVNESMVFGTVYRAAANALSGMQNIPSLSGKDEADLPKQKLSEVAAPFLEEKEKPREKRQIDLTEINREAMLPKYVKDGTKVFYAEEKKESEEPKRESFFFKEEPEKKASVLEDDYSGSTIPFRNFEREMTYAEFVPKETELKEDQPERENENSEVPENSDVQTKEGIGEKEEVCETSENVESAPRRVPKNGSPVLIKDADSEYRYYKIIGEIFNKYVLLEVVDSLGENKFIILDKHAAHERMLFESMRKRAELGSNGAQMLLVPIEIPTGPYEANAAELFKRPLDKFGFRIETGFKDITIHSIPVGMDEDSAKELFFTLLAELEEGIRKNEDMHLPPSYEKALFTVACKAAIKGGREYPPEMLENIVRAVLTDPKIRFCPHGRPVAFEITLEELDIIFKR